MKKLFNFLKKEDGQGMVEYGLIIGLIAVIVVAALVLLGPKIADLFNNIGNTIDSVTSAAS
jgi:pilus assembly protein Flp/PilA